MTQARPFGLSDLIYFLIVVLAAAGLRAGYLALACANGNTAGPIQVQDDWSAEREGFVQAWKENHRFATQAPLVSTVEITAHRAPVYPWLIALAEERFGNREIGEQWLRWLQAAFGAVTAGLYFLFARRAFQSVLIGIIAGLLAAVHPFWIVNAAEISDGVLATFLLALALWLGARGGQSGGALTSLLLGFSLAALAHVRAAFLPFAFVAMLWFLLKCRELARGWLFASLAFLGFLNGMIPWAVRNYRDFGSLIPVADSTYLHLWIGNNRDATGGPMSAPEQRKVLEAADRWQNLSQAPQPERYGRLARDVVNEITDRPGDTLNRRLRAFIAYFVGYDWLTGKEVWHQQDSAWEDAPSWLRQIAPTLLYGSLLALLALGVVGWRWTYAWRFASLPAALAMIWIPLPYVMSHAEALSGPRLPLDGVLLCYVAVVLASARPGLQEKKKNGQSHQA